MADGSLAANKALAQPREIEVDGKKYKVGRMRLCHWAALQQRLWDDRIAALARNRQLLGSPEAYARALAEIREPSEREVWEAAYSIKGATFLMALAVREFEPDVTEAQVSAWVDSDETLVNMFLKHSGLVTEKGAAGSTDPTKSGQ